MTQAETIKMLDSIMPDIISTRDPEGTMLKCASKHNLSPAQLEHLGQVYNTTKTIVGLEKQANRGNSFKLLNVPEMVSKYASYDPSKKPTGKSKDVHEKVDKIINDKDGWVSHEKKASAELPNLNLIVYNEMMKEAGCEDESNYYDTSYTEKSAAEKLYTGVNEDLRIAHENYDQALFDAAEDIMDKMASITRKLTPDEGRWEEVKYAAQRLHGDKIIPALNTIEDHFSRVGHNTEPGAFNKFASFGRLEDKYGVMKDIEDIYELGEFLKIAGAPAPPQNKNAPKKNSKGKEDSLDLKDVRNGVGSLVTGVSKLGIKASDPIISALGGSMANEYRDILRSGIEEAKDYKKVIDKAESDAKTETTLGTLLMTDPVISSADPEEVNKLYSAIYKIAPTLTESPELMAATLKEALQYGSIPLPTLLSLADFQGKYYKSKSDAGRL